MSRAPYTTHESMAAREELAERLDRNDRSVTKLDRLEVDVRFLRYLLKAAAESHRLQRMLDDDD